LNVTFILDIDPYCCDAEAETEKDAPPFTVDGQLVIDTVGFTV